MATTAESITIVRCKCGEATGVPCQWSGPRDETTVIEWMPEWLRASHEAAGNVGTHPHNGSVRIRVHADCAEMLAESDGAWVREVRSSGSHS